ncbi:HAD-IB family phosphatase, partial [Mycobacterium tuberculosis]|nr:HAD-IB family phosphatase [Mycobacterium tuberculosis]
MISALKNHGYYVVLVSGGFNYFAEYVKNSLGMDESYANDLDIVDNLVTGEITSAIVDGKRKAEILQAVAQRLGIKLSETVAVGDGANDLPMLGLADIGIAYRAKPIVRDQA